jgi:methylated-DNA-protein-cysteine methyltransferase-like protein
MKEPDFFELVYAIVREIPHGRVTSYGVIAKALGTPKSSRMVGYAMNAAHVHPDIPAHRVVNRIGLLTGRHHFGSPDRMEQLLQAEGIEVNDNQIVHFEAHFWDPLTELSPH